MIYLVRNCECDLIRKEREPEPEQPAISPQIQQLQVVLGSGVTVDQCVTLIDAAAGDIATAASMHFDGFSKRQPSPGMPRVTVPEGMSIPVGML